MRTWAFRGIAFLAFLGLALGMGGCTTEAAKKAMNKKHDEFPFSTFNETRSEGAAREDSLPDPVADDLQPDRAIDMLVDNLQHKELRYQIPAEDQLRYWATKQGVDQVIVRKVRMLLKDPRIEVRAPALRLTVAYGKRESVADLIEVLADEEYGMRSEAYKSLQRRTGRDFGFNPAAPKLSREVAVERWRQWWQEEQTKMVTTETAVSAGFDTPAPPRVVVPEEERAEPEVKAPDGEKRADEDLPEHLKGGTPVGEEIEVDKTGDVVLPPPKP